jgi:uncharacterized membrane protein YfcA
VFLTLANLTLAETPLVILVGAGAGLVGAMLGTGGGVFLIPILVLWLRMPMHQAVATSITSVIATSSAVASANVERGTANMRLGMTLEVATTIGAIAGALTAAWLSPQLLEGVFAIVLLPTAYLMFRGGGEAAVAGDADCASDDNAQAASASDGPAPAATESLGPLGASYYDEAIGRAVAYCVKRLWGGLLISFCAGNLSGLLGIGGGVFKTPALNLMCGVPMKAAAATSNFMIGVTAAASATLYYGRGRVSPAVTAAVVLGVLLGSAAGSLINRKVHDRAVQRLFAALLLAVSAQMLFRAFRGGE